MIKKITEMTEKELDEVFEIWLATNCDAHAFIGKDFWLKQADFVKAQLPQAVIFAYYKENQLIAFLGMMGTHIAGLFVKKEYQGRGIGKNLLDQAKRDIPELSLAVYEKNVTAVNFYLKQGFLVIEKTLDKEANEVEFQMSWRK